jgi:hypothetical protein
MIWAEPFLALESVGNHNELNYHFLPLDSISHSLSTFESLVQKGEKFTKNPTWAIWRNRNLQKWAFSNPSI